VLDVGEEHMQDIPYFKAIEQKMASFAGEQSWWYEMLSNGVLPWGRRREVLPRTGTP
jgi:hypothetical protein